MQIQECRKPARAGLAASSSAVTAAQAPSSCSAPRARVKVWSGWTLKRRTCGSSAASGVAPLTCAIQGPGSIARATSRIAASGTHSSTRSAPIVPERHAAFVKPGGDRRSHAAAADDSHAVEHLGDPEKKGRRTFGGLSVVHAVETALSASVPDAGGLLLPQILGFVAEPDGFLDQLVAASPGPSPDSPEGAGAAL